MKLLDLPKETLIISVISWILLLVLTLILNYAGISPMKRGFFSDDQDILYPYKDGETISTNMLVFIGYGVPLIIILPISIFIRKPSHELYGIVLFYYFTFFAFITQSATDFIKILAGSLRPDFISRCQPDYNNFNGTAQNFYDDPAICTGDTDIVEKGRRSFPSGHSSLTAYGMCFLVIYLQVSLITKKEKTFPTWRTFVVPIIQLGAIFLGIFSGLSRLTDNKHRYHDIVAGFLLGIVLAIYGSYSHEKFLAYCNGAYDRSNNKANNADNKHSSTDVKMELSSITN